MTPKERDTSDLEGRLRASRIKTASDGLSYVDDTGCDALCIEAADTIRDLRTERDQQIKTAREWPRRVPHKWPDCPLNGCGDCKSEE